MPESQRTSETGDNRGHTFITHEGKQTCTVCRYTWRPMPISTPTYTCPGVRAYFRGDPRPSHLLTEREMRDKFLKKPDDLLPEGAIRWSGAWRYLYDKNKLIPSPSVLAPSPPIRDGIHLNHCIVNGSCILCGQQFRSMPLNSCPRLHMYTDEDCPSHLITLPELRVRRLRPGSEPEAVLCCDATPGWLCLYDVAQAEPALCVPHQEATDEGEDEDELEELEELGEEPVDIDEVLTSVI